MADKNNSSNNETELKELKKLSPGERLKKLKELKEKKNKDIEDAEKLIKESIIELEKDETIRKIPLPEQKIVDLEKLFDFSTPEDKKKKEEKIKEDIIKEALESEMVQKDRQQVQRSYNPMTLQDINQNNPNLYRLSGQIYNTLKEFSSMDPQNMGQEQKQLLEAIVDTLPHIQINKSYNTADYVLDRLSASRKILKDMGYDNRFV